MLTVQDMQALHAIITSPRLTLNGAEALGVAQLQVKLQQTIKASQTPETPANGDSPRPAE